MNRFVALKFIPQPIRQFPEHLEDLDRACRYVRPVKHENIASVYEFIVTHDWAAFSMEAIDGETLADIVVKEPYGVFDIAKLSSYITEVCFGLHHAHDLNVVHDDIKPSNIMRVAEGGHIKVTDFHISRAINNAAANVVRRLTPVEHLPQNDFILRHGSAEALKFMSPQRAFGIEPTPQDDIYSLGATIYYLLTGSLPVRPEHLLNPIEATTPPKMSLKLRENGIRNRFIPASWDMTIAACLERKHQNRPQSILEFAHALDLDIGIPYKPKEEEKPSVVVSNIESTAIKQEEPSTQETFRFPTAHAPHTHEQTFFAAPPTPSDTIPSSSEKTAGAAFKAEAFTTPPPSTPASIKNDTAPGNFQSAPTFSTSIPATPTNPTPVSSSTSQPTAVQSGGSFSPRAERSATVQGQEGHQQPNFSRGPRSTAPRSAASPTSADGQIPTSSNAGKQDPGIPSAVHPSDVPPAPVPPPSTTQPPRPAAYTPPPPVSSAQTGYSVNGNFEMNSSHVSSPFHEEPIGQSEEEQDAYPYTFSEKTNIGSAEEPLPYEEIDEKDFRSSTVRPARKSSQRSDPANQRSRYSQRSRVSSGQDRSHPQNFNPPPPYAYQQQTAPQASFGSAEKGPTKKRSNWQRNLLNILLAVLIFYASVFVLWFGLTKAGILSHQDYFDKLANIFNKKSTPETITAPEISPPANSPVDSEIAQQAPPPPSAIPDPVINPAPNAPEPQLTAPLDSSTPALPEVSYQDQNEVLPQEPPAVTPDPSITTASTPITGPTKTVPDEYIQIQAAIDAAAAGDTIRIKAGVYTENIIFKEGIKIIGEGMDVVTLQCPPTSPAIDIRNIQSGHIEGITVMHTEKLDTENTPPLINITNSNVTIIRCRIKNSSGTGVLIANGSRAVLRQNIVENNNLFGVSIMDAGTTPIIERNQINNNQRVGLVFSNGAGGTATGNIIKENQWDGIAVLNPATRPTIQQNITIENQRRGIFFAKGAAGIAEGNTSEKNKMNGISILDEGTAPTISNNRVSNNELRGIHFGKGAKGIARGNISENNGDIGILIVDEGTRPELYNNTARNNNAWGIAIASGAQPPPSSGNIARENKEGQINFEQTR